MRKKVVKEDQAPERLPQIERNEVYRTLKTDFFEKERISMSYQMANCVREIKRLSDELSSVSSQYKTDIKKREAEMDALAEKINTGWEMRRTECVEEKNFDNGSITITRKDTGIKIEERAMTGEERQTSLSLTGKDGDKKEDVEEKNDLPEDDNPFYDEASSKENQWT